MIVDKAKAALEAALECHRLMSEAVDSHPRKNEYNSCKCYCCEAKSEAASLVKTIEAAIHFARTFAGLVREEA